MKKRVVYRGISVLVGCVLAVGVILPVSGADLSQEWETRTPASQQIDPAQLDTALNNASNYPGLRSLLIVRNGYLVSENYYADADKETLHPVHSASKSFIGALTGMAIEQSYIQSIDDPVSRYLGRHLDAWSEEKEQITIQHLLSMTNGLGWTDEDYGAFFESSEPVSIPLAKPMVAKPGKKFNYDISSFLLSAIIQETTGMSAYDFAQKHLFSAHGYGKVEWLTQGEYTLGFGGLSLRSRDMAKFGQLMIQGGFDGKKRLLSEHWVKEAAKPQVKTGEGLPPKERAGDVTECNYGHMYWLGWDDDLAFYWAGGLGGQRIICVPQKNLVVVMTAYVPPFSEMEAEDWQKADEQDRALLNYAIHDIFPAVN